MASTAVKVVTVLRGGGSYIGTVLGTSPIALWPLSETTGTNAADATGNGYTGTYSNVTLASTTFPDGTAAGLWVAGSNGHVTTYSAGLAGVFNGQEGAIACWIRVRAASVWTDVAARYVYDIYRDTTDRIRILKNSTSNRVFIGHRGGGTARETDYVTSGPTQWVHIANVWSNTGGYVRHYVNGVLIGDLAAPGTFATPIADVSMAIGTQRTNAHAPWDGYIKYMALWNRPLTPAEVATLAPAAFQV